MANPMGRAPLRTHTRRYTAAPACPGQTPQLHALQLLAS